MISQRAKAGFDRMVMQGMRASLVKPGDVVTELTPVPAWRQPPASHAVVLSVASLLFRMLVVVYFSDTPAMRRHFAGLSHQNAEDLSLQAFQDAVCEAGNLCCGSVNRDLGGLYAWVGMSTPHIVESHCTQHLGILKAGHLQHFQLLLDGEPPLHLTLCVSESENLDFDFQLPAPADQGVGELELF